MSIILPFRGNYPSFIFLTPSFFESILLVFSNYMFELSWALLWWIRPSLSAKTSVTQLTTQLSCLHSFALSKKERWPFFILYSCSCFVVCSASIHSTFVFFSICRWRGAVLKYGSKKKPEQTYTQCTRKNTWQREIFLSKNARTQEIIQKHCRCFYSLQLCISMMLISRSTTFQRWGFWLLTVALCTHWTLRAITLRRFKLFDMVGYPAEAAIRRCVH